MDGVLKKRRPERISRACENCRKRKIKCSGGPVCRECSKYLEPCIFRKHYREFRKVAKAETPTYVVSNGICPQDYTNLSLDINKHIQVPDYLSVGLSSGNASNEYFGPASNFSFVSQLNHFLRELEKSDNNDHDDKLSFDRFNMKPTVLEESSSNNFTLASITSEKMHSYLVAYLETWTVPCPIFKAEELFQLSSQTWKNAHAPDIDTALLYVVLSMGASAAYFDQGGSLSAFPESRGFFDLAVQTVPSIFSQITFDAVRVLFLMSISASNLGDTALSYIYSGAAVRTLIAIGLHKNNPVSSTFDMHHQRRVWTSTWQWEKYWSFCVGRPSCTRDDMPIPLVVTESFTCDGYGEHGRFKMNEEHMRLRVFFGATCSKIHSELYNSKKDLLTILSTVEKLSNDIDNAYFASKVPLLVQAEVDERAKDLDIIAVREWFWIRIYYLYLKLMIFRPFLIFHAYLKNTSADVPVTIRERLKVGRDICVNVAIELSTFIIKLNTQVRMIQPILFICTYLESTSTVLLFYIVSSLANIPGDLARKIWDVLQDTRRFLNGSSGPYLASTQLFAHDGLKSLYDVLMKKENSQNKTYFDKFMQPVMIATPVMEPSESGQKIECDNNDGDVLDTLDTAGLEDFWKQTLDWITYA
ncbi:CIC11C00000000442 [Sungouiella intermedia]|uniref:CIC11C00000000442 n=1 Tax=Sungouiella intermedia TaxID=45354 RepID=A0A1L0BIK1_9ASCO|nr:CIC11C00000000442 [[Candida] intermedia]